MYVILMGKVMQKEDFMIFSQFSDNLVMTLSRILMQIEDAAVPDSGLEAVTAGSPVLEKHLTKLAAQFSHFQAEGLPILQKYMKESNSSRLSHVTNMFSQRDFLQCVLIDEGYEEVRLALKDMLYSSP